MGFVEGYKKHEKWMCCVYIPSVIQKVNPVLTWYIIVDETAEPDLPNLLLTKALSSIETGWHVYPWY